MGGEFETASRSAGIIRMLAAKPADRYVSEYLVGPLSKILGCSPVETDVLAGLQSPESCLRALFSRYTFSRRGKDRNDLAAAAVEALDRLTMGSGFTLFLKQRTGTALWQQFVESMERKGRDPLEQLNRGIVQGFAELAQEAYRNQPGASIASWLVDFVAATGELEPPFMRIVDIRGVGPKVCSMFLRDIVYLAKLEPKVDHAHRIYVQPIDKWLRIVAPYVVDELAESQAPDWILAGKLSKYARRAGVSGIRFNMGASYFGMRVAGTPAVFERELERLNDEIAPSVGSRYANHQESE